jgi:hypothetical protein
MYGYTYGYPSEGGSGAVNRFESSVLADGGSVVAIGNTDGLYARLISLGLINSASLVNSCNAGKPDALYNFVPSPIQALDRFVVTRASTKNILGSAGLYVSVANDTPAFEFNTDGSYRGLLVEPGATNIALRSQEMGNAVWTTNGLNFIVTSNATTAPDGTTTADAVLADTTSGVHNIQQRLLPVVNGTYVWSVFLKRNGYRYVNVNLQVFLASSVTLDFDTGIATGGTNTVVQALPDGWYRLSASGVNSDGAGNTRLQISLRDDNNDSSFIGDDTKGVFAWQAQLETGSVATSPIVTAGSTVARSADAITLSSASSLIGQTANTLYIEGEIQTRTGANDACIFALTDGTSDEAIVVRSIAANGRIGAVVRDGGVDQAEITSGSFTTGLFKCAVASAVDDVAFYLNGSSVGTDTGATHPALSVFQFGGTVATVAPAGRPVWFRAISDFPTRIANATLVTLTTL